MSDVLFSSSQLGGHGAGDIIPRDQISLNFTRVKVEYKEQDVTGKLTGSTKKWFDFNSVNGG
jgi:type VI secretion system secreted protein Hcp